MNNPYLSVVIVGRNDNYGVDFAERLSNFVEHLDYQIRDHPNLLELIIVEWNPLPENLSIKEILPKTNNLFLRVLTVDNETHLSVGNKIPVYEWYGKNAGGRRAKGQFILFTNPDILFTDELITEFSKRRLNHNDYYRLDRYDFDSKGMSQLPKDQWINFAICNSFQAHIVKNVMPEGPKFKPVSSIWHLPKSTITDKSFHPSASGDFILVSKSSLEYIGGLFEDSEEIYHNDTNSMVRLTHFNFKHITFSTPLCIFHQDHPRQERDGPWNLDKLFIYVDKCYRLGSTKGSDNWGLKNKQLSEWNNK